MMVILFKKWFSAGRWQVYSCDFNNNQPPKTSKWQIYDKNTDVQIHIYVHTHVPEKAQNEPKLLEWKQRLTNSDAVLKVDQQSKFRTNKIRLGVNILWQFDVAGCIELFSTLTEITK